MEANQRFPMFFGKHGLRAGWRLLLFLVVAQLLGVLLFLAVLRPAFQHSMFAWSPVKLVALEMWFFLPLLGAAAAMARIEGRDMSVYGLPGRAAFGARFWEGVLWGLAALSLLLGALRMTGSFYFGQLALHGAEAWRWGCGWALGFVAVALFEEYSTRGYPLFTLATGMGFWPAAALFSALFGLLHAFNPNQNWISLAGDVLIGLFWCFSLQRTGSLWFAVGFHAAWDWGETFLYGVPDSGRMADGHLLEPSFSGPAWLTGGAGGPEGSVLGLPLILLLWLAVAARFPRRTAEQAQA